MSDPYFRLLVLPHLRIHNANALSSPYTIGFPAMTAWLGSIHALQRLLRDRGFIRLRFSAVAVISHRCDVQTYKGRNDYVSSIVGTGNPLEPKTDKDKPDGNAVRPSFIEEARCHLEISLLIAYEGIDNEEDKAAVIDAIKLLLMAKMKIAAGDILSINEPYFKNLVDEKQWVMVVRSLMPGYVLCNQQPLLQKAMDKGQDALSALLDYLAIHHKSVYVTEEKETAESEHASKEERMESKKVIWESGRKTTGWLVPIAVGFQGLTPLGIAKNQRDMTKPHCFAESVVTLGEFKMLHRIKLDALSQCLWRYHVDEEQQLYLCQPMDSDEPMALNDIFAELLIEEDEG